MTTTYLYKANESEDRNYTCPSVDGEECIYQTGRYTTCDKESAGKCEASMPDY